MKKINVPATIMFIFVVAQTINAVYVLHKYYELENKYEDMKYQWRDNESTSCSMRFPEEDVAAVNGLYQHPDYYCVWTRERSPEEIAKTSFHEMAHYFNLNNPEHFGEDFVNKSREIEVIWNK